MFKKIIDFITYPYRKYMDNKRFKKRLEELRKQDPFIYK
jgi:hypothetical protein